EVGHGHARPDAVAAGRAPLHGARRAVEADDVVGAPDDVGLTVAVEVRHCGRGVPARLAPGRKAAAALPLEDRRAEGGGLGPVRAGAGAEDEGREQDRAAPPGSHGPPWGRVRSTLKAPARAVKPCPGFWGPR